MKAREQKGDCGRGPLIGQKHMTAALENLAGGGCKMNTNVGVGKYQIPECEGTPGASALRRLARFHTTDSGVSCSSLFFLFNSRESLHIEPSMVEGIALTSAGSR